ncbi:hypothetical protein NPIL_504281 [Nephila pilipes]|uniref:Uncharacterized protein n=1 Tax=Nephila pilipes TaxID=299642 RepID=A0A8X6NTM7_NEPPI|nr:hypothetical protein NPIL_504281 [Nephila pilipes]
MKRDRSKSINISIPDAPLYRMKTNLPLNEVFWGCPPTFQDRSARVSARKAKCFFFLSRARSFLGASPCSVTTSLTQGVVEGSARKLGKRVSSFRF